MWQLYYHAHKYHVSLSRGEMIRASVVLLLAMLAIAFLAVVLWLIGCDIAARFLS